MVVSAIEAYVRAMLDAAMAAAADGRPQESATLIKLVVGSGFHDGYSLYLLGRAQHEMKQFPEAAAALSMAVMIEPWRAEAFNDLAAALFALDRSTEALGYLRRSLDIDPTLAEAEESDGIWLLRYGRFEEGWRKYEARYRTAASKHYRRDFTQPQWRGEAASGRTILLHAEQGMGDAIQFVRYAPLVAAQGLKVILEVHRPVAVLLAGMPGADMVLSRGDALPHFDLHCPLLSLPLAFGTDLDSIPAAIPYIAPPPRNVLTWTKRLGPKRTTRIGVVWSGNPGHRDDARRSIPLADFARILPNRPDREYHVLQYEVRATDRAALARLPHIRDHSNLLADFRDTAALLSLMDLIVTVDTSVAHLAGAMGWPVWMLISALGDWRWMLERDDSPWYPTMTLFRQQTLGDWTPVLEGVARQLDDMLA